MFYPDIEKGVVEELIFAPLDHFLMSSSAAFLRDPL